MCSVEKGKKVIGDGGLVWSLTQQFAQRSPCPLARLRAAEINRDRRGDFKHSDGSFHSLVPHSDFKISAV